MAKVGEVSQALLDARNQLTESVRSQHLIGALIVLIFVTSIAAVIATSAAFAMWYSISKVDDLKVDMMALESGRKAEWDDWKRIQERELRIIKERTNDVELRMEGYDVRSGMHN